LFQQMITCIVDFLNFFFLNEKLKVQLERLALMHIDWTMPSKMDMHDSVENPTATSTRLQWSFVCNVFRSHQISFSSSIRRSYASHRMSRTMTQKISTILCREF